MWKSLFEPDERAKKRMWWMYHGCFILLLAHFVLVYAKPGYFQPANYRMLSSRAGGPPAQRLIVEGDRKLLHGGDQSGKHFDVTEFRLNPDQLHYGIGREAFPALIEPQFVSATQADAWLTPDARVLAVKIEDEVKVYPIDLLIRHEVVNDTVGDVPIFAAYCILADLGAVYDRRVGQHTLTFALSGYTYADPMVWNGMDAFVLWDRDTESLWWPPLGKAVSGPFIDAPLNVLDQSMWSQTNWGEVREKYENVVVLQTGQDMERPVNWTRLELDSEVTQAFPDTPTAIAPKWGENQPW